MTYFSNLGISSNLVAGAVAEAALHDLQVNHFTFPGFPQVLVVSPDSKTFTITLSWLSLDDTVSFELTAAEAKAAVKRFTQKDSYDKTIFPKVQDALVRLEAVVSNRK